MSKNILIAGSGNVSRDLGIYFVKRGQSVSWVTRTEDRLIDLQTWVDNSVKMFMSYSTGKIRQLSASFFVYEELENDTFDIIIECSTESMEDKKGIYAALDKYVLPSTILCSTTQTLACPDFHPACCKFGITLPFEHSKTADVVFPVNYDEGNKSAFLSFCNEQEIVVTVKK